MTVGKLSHTINGFLKNAWWSPVGFAKNVKSAVKAHPKATVLVCTGIVSADMRGTWKKTIGTKRAILACATARLYNPKLKVKVSYRVAKKSDALQSAVILKFNK